MGSNLENLMSVLLKEETESKASIETVTLPNTLYHGATAEFEEFDTQLIGKRDSGNLGTGVYLTTDDDIAMRYAEDNAERFGGKPVVLEVEHTLEKVANFDKLVPHLEEKLGIEFPPRANDPIRSKKLRDWFTAHGFDAAVSGGHEVVVFDYSKLDVVGNANAPSTQERLQQIYRDKMAELNKESNLENLLSDLLNEEISAETEEQIKNADPNDIMTVYHGTALFRLPDLINGFDSTAVHSRDYGGPKHRGLFVTSDFEVAKTFGGGAILEIKVRAKNLHGTDYSGNIGRVLKKRDSGLADWAKEKFPNSFRPYMAMTMLQNVEPQALLVGLVKPSQITRVWVKNLETKEWDEYTREEFLKSEMEFSAGQQKMKKFGDAGIDLSSPNLTIRDVLEALAVAEDISPDRIESAMKFAEMRARDPERLREWLANLKIHGSRLGKKAIDNIVKQMTEKVDESIAPLSNLIDFLTEGSRGRSEQRPAWMIRKDKKHQAKMAKLRQQRKEKGLGLLSSLPKRTKITGWEEFVHHPYPENSKKYQFWQTDKEGEVIVKRRKAVPKNSLPKYMYHGTNLAAAMKILGSQSKSNLNLSANPGYPLTYVVDALESDEIPVAVIRVATKDLDTRFASLGDDFAAENIVYKKPIPGSKFKLFQVGVPDDLLECTTSHAPLETLLEYLLIEGRTQTDETLEKVLDDWVEHDKRAPKGPHWFPPRELFRYREFHRRTRPDLKKSMEEKGFDPKYPIQLAFGKNGKIVIVEGNHRLKTAIQLNIDKVPVEFNFMKSVEKWQDKEDQYNMMMDKERLRKQQAKKRKEAEERKLGLDSMEKLLQQQREKRQAELDAMSPEEREQVEKEKEKKVDDIMKLIGF